MKFGDTPLSKARGAILAHSIRIGARTLKKGIVLKSGDIKYLDEHGVNSLVVARLSENDLDENKAAQRLAKALKSSGFRTGRAGTGRCNLIATRDGVIQIDRKIIDNLNQKNEAITISTVGPNTVLKTGDIAATVKIITFGVSDKIVSACCDKINQSQPFKLYPFKKLRVGLIQTTFPGFKNSLIEKAHQATQNRIDALGSDFSHEIICGHEETEITAAILEMHRRKITTLLILGASAITDRRDIVPQAVLKAGGKLEHFGMPVDPGNLLLLANLKTMDILGIPGSARSPRLHGFDWILQRLAAGISVGSKDITAMGVGGLLKEIPTRPMPRKHNETQMPTERKNLAAIILAAGQSRRMGKENKMLIKIDGKPMVRHAVEAVMQTGINRIFVVTGYQSKKLENALNGLKFKLVKNSQYSQGLSSSLKAGVNALPESIEGALVMLGDMPGVNPSHLNLLMEAFKPDENKLICVPTSEGKRGNPVLWHKRFFSSISEVSGDVGARHLIGEYDDYVVDVEMNDNAVILDLDTPEAVQAYLKADK